MTIKELAERYIENTRHVLHQLEKTGGPRDEKTERVLHEAKNYLQDAVYYTTRREFETALASVAYSEGLLDALRLLGTVNFQWETGSK